MHITEAKEFAHLLWPDIERLGDVYLLAASVPDGGLDVAAFSDLTEVEAFHNHVHVLDWFEHGAALDGSDPERGFWDKDHPDFITACALGRTIAASWRAKLAADFPGERFRVYFTADDAPVVRFHLVRPTEPVWLDEQAWTVAISMGRVVVLETGNSDPEQAA